MGRRLLRRCRALVGKVDLSAFDFGGAVVKGVSSFVGGLISGLFRIVGGIISLDWSLIREGLIIIGGKLISFVQTASYFLQPNKRKLTAEEKQLLKRVFRNSLTLYNIRLVEGFAGLFSLNSRPFTLGDVVYLKNRDVSAEPELLVHECVHVWQYQNVGARYTADALGAQWFGNEYDWEKEIQEGRTDWVDFNRESQGKFLEDLYTDGELIEGHSILRGNAVFYDADGQVKIGRFIFNTDVHTDRANDAVVALRREKSFRMSQLFG